MISRRRLLHAGLTAGLTVPWLGRRAWAATGSNILTATDVHVADYPTVVAVRWLGETLSRETNGRLGLRMYHSGQLGRESEAIDMARYGAIDITRVYAGALNNAFPLTQALCLPYVFDSSAHLRRALDGGLAQQVLDSFQSRELVGLAIYDSGARCFYNIKKPIYQPADLHGLKIRVPVSDIFLSMLHLFGANPTPLSLGEVFSGLETHMIDGAENNISSFYSSRHFEAAHFWSHSEHSYAPDVLLISQRSLMALRASDRDLLISIAKASVNVMRQHWDDTETQARQAVLKSGVKFNEVDRPAFVQAAQPLLSQYRQTPAIDSLYRRIRDFA